MYVTRHMEPVVLEVSSQYPALLIVGPRQVGKTTMLEHLIEVEGRGRTVVTLDDLTERELAKTDPKMFFQLHKPPLLIDEVQYAPELFPYIKMMVDQRHQPGDSTVQNDGGCPRISGRESGFAPSVPHVPE